MKRVILLIATNLAILAVASIVMSLLGVNSRSMEGLLVFAAIFGFGGAFISLAISKWVAKRSMGCEVITNPETIPNAGCSKPLLGRHNN